MLEDKLTIDQHANLVHTYKLASIGHPKLSWAIILMMRKLTCGAWAASWPNYLHLHPRPTIQPISKKDTYFKELPAFHCLRELFRQILIKGTKRNKIKDQLWTYLATITFS